MKKFNSTKFREELVKIMPGYSWTVHRSIVSDRYLSATGIQSSGFNRISTLQVTRLERDDESIYYKAKSSGFGKRAPWFGEFEDATLARALRGLQNHYEIMAATYSNHAGALQHARKQKKEIPE